MGYYEKYDTNQIFIKNFIEFSKFYRKDYNVSPPSFWPLEKLYLILGNMDSGFFIERNQITCLGLQIEVYNDVIYRITYRDPFYPQPKHFFMNILRLVDENSKFVRVQWFGNFNTLHKYNYNPSFSKFAEYGFKYELPKDQEVLLSKDPFLCGDICSYLAFHGKANFFTLP